MKTMMPAIRITIMISAAVMLLGGCRKALCYNHDEHAPRVRVNIVTEWEQEWERNVSKNWESRWRGVLGFGYDDLRPEVSSGLRAKVFSDGNLENEYNIKAEGDLLNMTPGVHDILMYNNDTEYIVFHETSSSATAMASTRTRTRSTYNERFKNETTVNAPDQLYGAFIPEYNAEKTLEQINVPAQMRPLVYTYVIHYIFKNGLKYVGLARGALSGMAEGVYLQSGRTTEGIATILFDECTVDQNLGIYATVLSFGVPDEDPLPDKPHEGHEFMLNLEVRLKNGKILNFDYDVTDQVREQPKGGVIVIDGIEISDEDGLEGAGGFDVTIEGWGEFQDIELSL